MIKERCINEEWICDALLMPMHIDCNSYNNICYFKSISERDGGVLHFVVNQNTEPLKVVNVFLIGGKRNEIRS